MMMNRREAIARLAVLMGGAVVGAEAFLRGSPVGGDQAMPGFSDEDRALLDEIGEAILPATTTPGAKAAGIGSFMIVMVNDCYDPRHRAIFKEGLVEVDSACRAKTGKSFMASSPDERAAFLNALDAEQKAHHARKAPSEPEHYFRLMKQLAILGYFTSEIGCTQALRYIETPGAYRSDPYKKGDRAWYQSAGTQTLYGDGSDASRKTV